jgi:hypothetical protein
MIRYNCDPKGLLPPTDEHGRLILTESIKERIGMFFFLALSSVWFVLTSCFWIAYLQNKIPEIWINVLKAPSYSMPVAFLVTLFFFIAVAYPRRLIISELGVSYRTLGNSKSMEWNEILDIRTEEVPISGRDLLSVGVQTVTKLSGSKSDLAWMPIFSVEPIALANYISNRRNKRSSIGRNISVTTDPSIVKDFLEIRPRTIVISFVLLVVVLALLSVIFHIQLGSKPNNFVDFLMAW